MQPAGCLPKRKTPMRRMAYLVPLTLSLLVSISTSAQAQSTRQIAQKTFPSVVLLVMEDRNGQPVGLGSGFFVGEDIVATNLHVVEGAAGGYARIVGRKRKYNISGLVASDSRRDLVLLKVDGAKARPLPLGDSSEIAVGDTVYAVGNPRGLEGTFSEGIISGIRQIGGDTLLQITAPISPGSSGGPVLNASGEVIGIAVASFKGGQNLNFAIPSSYVEALLSRTPKLLPLSSQRRTTEQGTSILDAVVASGLEEVKAENLAWSRSVGGWTLNFTIRNNLREAITDIYYLVIFYDARGNPVDVKEQKLTWVVVSHTWSFDVDANGTATSRLDAGFRLSTPGSSQSRFSCSTASDLKPASLTSKS